MAETTDIYFLSVLKAGRSETRVWLGDQGLASMVGFGESPLIHGCPLSVCSHTLFFLHVYGEKYKSHFPLLIRALIAP